MPPQERLDMARKMALGEDVQLPAGPRSEADELADMLFQNIGSLSNRGESQRLGRREGAGTQATKKLTAADTTAVSTWRQQLTSNGWELDPNNQELIAMLAEAGLEPDEIALILRGR